VVYLAQRPLAACRRATASYLLGIWLTKSRGFLRVTGADIPGLAEHINDLLMGKIQKPPES
jgi:hypothetical protein